MFDLKNHPIHPAIVHFPIVFWTSSTLLELCGLYWNDDSIWQASYYLVIVGNIAAVFAVLCGIYELEKVKEEKAWRCLELHVVFMLLSFLLYATTLWLKIQHLTMSNTARIEVMFSVSGFLTLLIGAFYGATLVYKYEVGVKK